MCVGGGGGGVRTKQWRGNVVYNLYKHGLNTAEVHARNTRQKYTPDGRTMSLYVGVTDCSRSKGVNLGKNWARLLLNRVSL